MAVTDDQPLETWLRPTWLLSPALTLAPLRHGAGDPTLRFTPTGTWRASRTPLGPATIHLVAYRDGYAVKAWGAGREWAVESLPRLLGSEDRPEEFNPPQGLLRDLHRRLAGLRLGRSDAVLESLVPAIIEQKVTGTEARRAYHGLLRRYGEPAPGPGGLLVPPSPERLLALPYHAFHPLGLEARRAVTILRAAERSAWLEAATTLAPDAARARLQAVPGIGPWTAAEVARSAFGDPDAISVGDFHLPQLVCWALTGDPTGDDVRMLELLDPYRGQRGRVQRLLEASGMRPPRHGPRMSPRSIGAL